MQKRIFETIRWSRKRVEESLLTSRRSGQEALAHSFRDHKLVLSTRRTLATLKRKKLLCTNI